MKLLFASFSPIIMDVATPEREPLGGTKSCAAYLARQLGQNGHDVSFVGRLPPGTPERIMGVRHLPLEALTADLLGVLDFEAVITLGAPAVAKQFKEMAPRAFHVCWLHLWPDQTGMAPLATMAPYIDNAVFVSRTQQAATGYKNPSAVIGNGIAPAFEAMFATAQDMHAVKENRAVYTSMPYRGLHLLVDVIGKMGGATRFDIYSAMQTYRAPETDFTALYERVKAAPRTHYHGAVPQKALADALRPAAFLAYPSAFLETYCIAALEAIAAGLKVVAFNMGALPETTLGFADLLPVTGAMEDEEIVTRFTTLLEKNAATFLARPEEWAAERFAQSQAVNRLCSWRARAAEWEKLLAPAIAARRGA